MQAKREYRNRDDTEVAVLDALVDRQEEGMTVLELRARVEADIDDIESALTRLKEDALIEAVQEGDRTVIRPDERVIPQGIEDVEPSLIDRLRDRFPL